jgi:hypothetical protein
MKNTKSNAPEFILKKAPCSYPATPQQVKMKAVAKACGIQKGMKKSDLMTIMKECVGPIMRGEIDVG